MTPLPNLIDFACQSIVVNRVAEQNRNSWLRLIENTLFKWLQDPSQLEDDGVDAPSVSIIRQAIEFAIVLHDQGEFAPTGVVPDASGGIVFERRSGTGAESYQIWDNGSVEYFRFEGTRLVERRAINRALPSVVFYSGSQPCSDSINVSSISDNSASINRQSSFAAIGRFTVTAAAGMSLMHSVTASTTL